MYVKFTKKKICIVVKNYYQCVNVTTCVQVGNKIILTAT